jgi:hypothetical protein
MTRNRSSTLRNVKSQDADATATVIARFISHRTSLNTGFATKARQHPPHVRDSIRKAVMIVPHVVMMLRRA